MGDGSEEEEDLKLEEAVPGQPDAVLEVDGEDPEPLLPVARADDGRDRAPRSGSARSDDADAEAAAERRRAGESGEPDTNPFQKAGGASSVGGLSAEALLIGCALLLALGLYFLLRQ